MAEFSRDKSMKILFCGTIVPEKYDTKLNYMSPAANRFQINFMKSLVKMGHTVNCLSYIGFPIEVDIAYEIKEQENEVCKYVIRQQSILKSILEYNKKLVNMIGGYDAVICYNQLYVWSVLPILFKSKSILILADFSEPVSEYGKIRKLISAIDLQLIKRYNLVIGLSEKSKRFLGDKQPFICMEGGLDKKVFEYLSKENPVKNKKEKKVILYSGMLTPVTGVDLLLEAIKNIKYQNFEIFISGKGKLERDVIQASHNDKRIKWLGYMEFEEYLEVLKNVDIVINPRNMNLPENQNNFPSKIIEYLASGNKIISTKFPGWEKFKDNIVFCEADAKSIADVITECLIQYKEGDIYMTNRKKAKEFLWEKQVKRVLDTMFEHT